MEKEEAWRRVEQKFIQERLDKRIKLAQIKNYLQNIKTQSKKPY